MCLYCFSVPSQVVVARTLTKKNAMMSVTTKVVMQLNCKLGGELWALEIPVSVIKSLFLLVTLCCFGTLARNSATDAYPMHQVIHTGQ